MSSKANSNGSFAGILLGTLFVVAAVGLFEFGSSLSSEGAAPARSGARKNKSNSVRTANEIEVSISNHVKETSQAIENDNARRKILNSSSPTLPSALVPRISREEPLPLDSLDDQKFDQTSEIATEQPPRFQSPRDVIYNELADLEAEKKRLELERREYLRRYVENAKAKGWHVELNDDGTVRRVSPLPRRQALPIEEPDSP